MSLLGCWMAMDLYYWGIDQLQDELSMHQASIKLQQEVDKHKDEPYCALLGNVHSALKRTCDGLGKQLRCNEVGNEKGWIKLFDDLLVPLMLCHCSLIDVGMENIAHSKLEDLICQVACFGTMLVQLDLHQNSEVHANALSKICTFYKLSDYLS